MRSSQEIRNLFPAEKNVGDEECSACGNAKSLRSCQVCAKEMAALEYREKSSANKLSASNSDKPKRQEIPKDETGKPKYGPGSDKWEESKRKLGIH